MKIRHTLYFALPALSALAALSAHAAPVAPDAGQTIRELQKQPELNAPKSTTTLRLEENVTRRGSANDDVRIVVSAIRVSGSSAFAAGELEALVANLVGSDTPSPSCIKGRHGSPPTTVNAAMS